MPARPLGDITNEAAYFYSVDAMSGIMSEETLAQTNTQHKLCHSKKVWEINLIYVQKEGRKREI